MGGRVLHFLVAALAVGGLAGDRGRPRLARLRALQTPRAGSSASAINAASGIDSMDPALASSPPGWALLDTTCARLMAYPDKPPPAGFRLQPEVAADFPSVSRDGRTFTFRLRNGFRFSDGSPVRASAFARAINRMLAPEMRSPGLQYVRDIVGAGQVVAGKASDRLRRRRAREHARRAAHPSGAGLSQPDGVDLLLRRASHAADRRRGPRRISRGRAVLRRRLPARRAGRAATEPVLRRRRGPTTSTASTSISAPRHRRRCSDASIEGGGLGPHALRDLLRSVPRARREVRDRTARSSQLRPGLTLRLLAFNSARPLFRDNPRLRKAVNFALDRRALVLVGRPAREPARPTSTCPRAFPGSGTRTSIRSSARTWQRAKELAQGSLRSGKAVLYVNCEPAPDGDRPAREAAARRRSGSRWRCAASRSTARPRRTSTSSPPRVSRGTSRSACGHRATSTRTRTSTCSSTGGSSGPRTSRASPRARTTSRCDRLPGSPRESARQSAYSTLDVRARPRLRADRRRRRAQRADPRLASASAASSFGPCST